MIEKEIYSKKIIKLEQKIDKQLFISENILNRLDKMTVEFNKIKTDISVLQIWRGFITGKITTLSMIYGIIGAIMIVVLSYFIKN